MRHGLRFTQCVIVSIAVAILISFRTLSHLGSIQRTYTPASRTRKLDPCRSAIPSRLASRFSTRRSLTEPVAHGRKGVHSPNWSPRQLSSIKLYAIDTAHRSDSSPVSDDNKRSNSGSSNSSSSGSGTDSTSPSSLAAEYSSPDHHHPLENPTSSSSSSSINGNMALGSATEHHGWWDGGDMPQEDRAQWLSILEDRFSAADMDGDGWLSVEELRNVLECTDQFCLSRHWLPLEQAALVMRKYDKEHNGKLSFDEFVGLADDHQLLMGVLDDYLEAFQAIDSDGSGRIERSELRGVLEATLGSDADNTERIERIMDDVFSKANLSGDYDTICFSEFLELIRSHTVDLQMVLDYMKLKPLSEVQLAAERELRRERIGDGMAQSLMGEVEESPELTAGEVVSVHSYGQLQSVIKENPVVMLMVTFKWCRPCKMFAKKYRDFAAQFPSAVLLKVMGDESEVSKAMLKRLNVKLSPTFVLWQGGERVGSHSGANEAKVRQMLVAATTASPPEAEGDPNANARPTVKI